MITEDLIKRCGLKKDPRYYSGKPARLADLNSSKLEEMFLDIKDIVGDSAAENFYKMVEDLPIMYTTTFLKSLYRLESKNWEWKTIYIGENLCLETVPQIISTIAKMLIYLPGKKDETEEIRADFLTKYKI